MRHDIPVKCKCSHPRARHAVAARGYASCDRPGCGCTAFRTSAPAIAAPPRVVRGVVVVAPLAVTS
jgi:hypothetical protein